MEIHRNKETFVMCPYDPSHHIRKYRMVGHLVKCRRNYPDADIATCDFNATHNVPKPELAYHHEHCFDRNFAELTIYQEICKDTPSSPKTVSKPVNFANFPTEEWVDEVEHSYDPQSYCLKNEILRKIDVQPRSNRRNFRIMERQRLSHLKESKEAQDKGEEERDQHVCQMLEILSTGPVARVIPKIAKNNDELPNNIAEEESKLKGKKNN